MSEVAGLPAIQVGSTARSRAEALGVACFACGALPGEQHDRDAHREYARAALG